MPELFPLTPAAYIAEHGVILWRIPNGPDVHYTASGTYVETRGGGQITHQRFGSWSDAVKHYAREYHVLLYPPGSTPSLERARVALDSMERKHAPRAADVEEIADYREPRS